MLLIIVRSIFFPPTLLQWLRTFSFITMLFFVISNCNKSLGKINPRVAAPLSSQSTGTAASLFSKLNGPVAELSALPTMKNLTLLSHQLPKSSVFSNRWGILRNLLKKKKKNSLGDFNSSIQEAPLQSSKPLLGGSMVKVITDIDDTVVSSGGLKLFGIKFGGVDNRYRRGQVYPGVIQFALELSRSELPVDKSSNAQVEITSNNKLSLNPDKVAVLTARANEFKFALALKESGMLCRAYRAVGISNGLFEWGIGDVYYGSVVEWVLHNRKGLRKFKNFEIMLQRDDHNHKSSIGTAQRQSGRGGPNISEYPTRSYVLIGDTGEKDEEAGELMARYYPSRVKAVFLHAVSRLKPKSGQNFLDISVHIPADRNVNGVPIFYFRTYVGAAVKAYQNNLISKDGVMRVTESALKELESIDNRLVKSNFLNRIRRKRIAELQALRWKELHDDIRSCNFLKDELLSEARSKR